MDIKGKFKNWIQQEDGEYLEVDEKEVMDDSSTVSKYEEANSDAVDELSADTKMVIFEPRKVEDADEIATRLMQDRAAVINVHKLDDASKQRIVDILYGVCFALRGKLKQIDHNVFLCTPRAVGVQGGIFAEVEEA